LIGADERAVVAEIGEEPRYRVKDESSTYLLYRGSYVEVNMWVAITPWPIPMPFPLEKQRGTDCLLLQFDDAKFTRFEFKSLEPHEAMNCTPAFWTAEEIQDLDHIEILFGPTAEAKKQRAQLAALAESGDADAQFRIYKQGPTDDGSFRWLCIAANRGHALAQEEMGDLSMPGRDQWPEVAMFVQPNEITAYLWYSLAASNGLKRASFVRGELSKEMTSEKIAKAERLVAGWEPNLAECETIGAQTEN
jgi:hypothetical protein